MKGFKLSNPHGDYFIPISSEKLLVKDVLKINGIPYNSVTAYVINNLDHSCKAVPFLNYTVEKFCELHSDFDIVFMTDRNIDYELIVSKNVDIYTNIQKDCTLDYVFDQHDGANRKHLFMSSEDCHSFVHKEVANFFSSFIKESYDNKKIIVGISGGGDSNTLLKSILSLKVRKENIIPVIILGMPDWDTGLPRAQQICQEAGLELQIIESKLVNNIIAGTSTNIDWTKGFLDLYPDSDLEMIGTLVIRLVLSYIARQNDTDMIVTGLNLEDILAEAFYAIFKKEPLLPFPVREVDGINILYPLYRCPKRILDGCYPKLSLENYTQRSPNTLYWRAHSYYLAQSISTIVPGMEFILLDGLQKQSERDHLSLQYYNELGFSALPHIPLESLQKWKSFISQIV